MASRTAVAYTPVRPKDKFLVFGAPAIQDEEIQEVVHSLKSGWLGTGPKVMTFEKDFRAYKGWGFPVALGSCTAALHLSLLAARLQPGDEVICPALTFCASVNAVIHAGATPVLVDVDPDAMTMDASQVEASITDRTRALLPVHFAGRACDMDSLCEIAARRNLWMIEDCAHAIETEYKGRKAGTFGNFGCFSFYVTKNVVTGEGGMVLAAREEDAAMIKMLALHGLSKDAWKRFSDEGYKHYQVVASGFKCNMMDIQAALGIHQLRRVETNWLRRQEIWRQYDEAFANLPVETPVPAEPNTRHGYHLYTILVDERRTGVARDAFLTAMTEENIGVGVHYLSLPEHKYYQDRFGWRPEDYPNAMQIGRTTVSLPLSPNLTDGDVEDVITAVKKSCG
jgi:dTDP-4-amino-4,6-dideoxygalactose transaminase